MKRLVLILTGLLVMTFVLASRPAVGQSNTEDRLSALETQVAALEEAIQVATPERGAFEPGPADLDPTDLQSGGPVTWGQWTMDAVGTEFLPVAAPNSGIDRVAHGVYLVAYFEITNISATPLEFPFTEMKITDSQGRTFTTDEEATVAFQIVTYGDTPRVLELQPGLVYSFAFLFDVPTEASGFVFSDQGGSIQIPLGA